MKEMRAREVPQPGLPISSMARDGYAEGGGMGWGRIVNDDHRRKNTGHTVFIVYPPGGSPSLSLGSWTSPGRPHKSCELAARLKLRPNANAMESNQGETFIFRPQSDIEEGTRRNTGIMAVEVKARKSETCPCHEVPATPVGMARRFSPQVQRALNSTLGYL
jgi:hypothetical protein